MGSVLLLVARRRRRVAAALLAVMSLNTACYVDKPITTAPAPGQQVSLVVSDQGRVALGPQLGAGVHVVEGTLASVEGEDMMVRVARVRMLNGPTSNWSGEQVRVRRGDVAVFQERRLSKRRSFLVAGVVVAGIALFSTPRSLLGLGDDDPVNPPPDPGPDQ
jgi:hypothetical protein